VDFLVESTGIADNVAARSSSPECGLGCLAVSTGGSFSSTRRYSGVLRLHQGPVGAVHLVVEPTGIAQVVTRVVSAP